MDDSLIGSIPINYVNLKSLLKDPLLACTVLFTHKSMRHVDFPNARTTRSVSNIRPIYITVAFAFTTPLHNNNALAIYV